NQGTLHEEVRAFLDDSRAKLSVSASTVDGKHGRIETRTAIENRLHWCLDVSMNEDQMRTRLGHGPENLATRRHLALNLVGQETSKGSLRKKTPSCPLGATPTSPGH
ncbi:MAG: hypothetical protein ACREFO_16075, partial [Acetobacteraceae bacterium]